MPTTITSRAPTTTPYAGVISTTPQPYVPQGGYTDVDITGGQGPEDIREYKGRLGTDYNRLIEKQRAIDARYLPGGAGADYYMPYFAEEAGVTPWYEPGDIRPYVNWAPGTEPTAENVRSQHENDMLNRIAELLELQERFEPAMYPGELPWVVQNIEGYKGAEQQRMAERKGRAQQVWNTWNQMLKNKQESEEAKKFGNKVLSTATDIFTLGL